MEGAEHRRRGLGRPELGVEQARGRVVDDGEEGRPHRRRQAQPGMRAAIEMEQLAEAGARLPPAPVAAARPALAHEAGFLEGELDEAVREGHGVLAPGKAIEVADVPAGKAVAIEAQEALDLEGRRFPARGAQAAPVIEGDDPAGFVARPPAPHAPGIEAEDIGRLQPADRPTQRPHDDLLDFHGPLQGGRGENHRRLLG
jgi:hypothetical protein